MNKLLTDPYSLAQEAAQVLKQQSLVESIDLAVTLGSGWKDAAEQLGTEIFQVEAAQIPGFAAPQVEGHSAMLRIIETAPNAEGKTFKVLVLGARTHYYEGKGVNATVHGVRVAAEFGARTMVLTNGCGGIRKEWAPGTAVLLSDHINFTSDSPITGAKFVDQTHIYSPKLREIARTVQADLPEGVYMQFRGPFYESPAEVKMAGIMGADLVGMSTVLEAMAAREAGLEVLAYSLVTNFAAGICDQPLNHQEVIDAGNAAAPRISKLLAGTIQAILDQQ